MKGKTKRNIGYASGVAAIILLIGAVVMFGGGDASNKSTLSTSALAAEENNFIFGTVPINGGDVAHEFTASNNGEEVVVINKIYTSCACTTAFIIDASGKKYGAFGMPGHGLLTDTKIEVAPGESITVEAVYDPAKHGPSGVGFADRSIYLETNSAESPRLEFSFQANVTP